MTNGGGKIWICQVCGFEHEGDSPPDECPVCGVSSEEFAEKPAGDAVADTARPSTATAEYLGEWARPADEFEEKFARIAALAKGEKPGASPMRTQRTFPDWSLILFKGGQLHRPPLNEDEEADTGTVIGKSAAKPLRIDVPFYVSHMSFGALSREAKIALARGSKEAGTAIGSGEGGMLPDERAEAGAYIYELGTATFSHKEEAIKQADAVEIKIGQAAKPGLGGHLPADKVTEEIGKIRGIAVGEDSISPGRHTGIASGGDLKARVAEIRELCGGRPVGVKISAGHIEEDMEIALYAEPDFITVDCRGGGTGSAPTFVKDNVCVPPVFAVPRARKCLDRAGSDVTLCVTGGFRDGSDIAKALALGADAVALATASLIAIGCQQYRICNTGRCPVGIATQDPELRKRLEIGKSAERLANFFSALKEELITFARINGRSGVHELDLSDIVTTSNEISANTDVAHV